MKYKAGDIIVCKRKLEYTEADDCYPGQSYNVISVIEENKIFPLAKKDSTYLIISENRALFKDDLKKYFYSRKEVRRIKLDEINGRL